jgi:tetratricopeptide (TPR) repeat protein
VTRETYNSASGCTIRPRRIELALLLLLAAGGILTGAAQTADQIHAQAAAALAAGKPQVAVSVLEPGARRFPSDLRLQYDLGLAYIRAGLLERAVRPLQKAAKDTALAGDAHFLLGAAYFERGEYAKALNECRGIENSPHEERILYIVEESSRRTGKLDEAKAAFHELITRYPDSAWTHYLLGNAYEQQERLQDAIAEYKLALQRDGSIPSAKFAIGYLYWRQQDTEDAKEWLGKEAASGCHALANFYLGEIARAERDLTEAEKRYRRAVTCDPSNSQAHLRLGIVLADTKRYTDALAQLKEAAKLRPDDSSAHYHLASVYTRMGRAEAARAEYQKVREIQAAKDNGIGVMRAMQ